MHFCPIKVQEPPGSKLAVLPRLTCWLSADSATVELYDQGDDYVLLRNRSVGISVDGDLFVSVGIAQHRKQSEKSERGPFDDATLPPPHAGGLG